MITNLGNYMYNQNQQSQNKADITTDIFPYPTNIQYLTQQELVNL